MGVMEVTKMKTLEKIHTYLKSLGFSQEEIKNLDSASVYIAKEIAIYAHRNQTRLNGEPYVTHPFGVLDHYRKFVNIIEDDYFCIDVDLLAECQIPFDGVQECCLLHDVLEDTEVTLAQIQEVYEDLSLKSHFEHYVKPALILLTHDKSQDYATYICNMIHNPIACMVKFMDMADNLNPATLDTIGKNEVERIYKYAVCCQIINDRWHFLENVQKYFELRKKSLHDNAD